MDAVAYQRGSVVLSEDAEPSAEFDRIYRAERGAIQRHLLYLTGDRQRAEDLTQETFARLYERELPAQGSALRNPRAWLLTVASNLAYNDIRAESRRDTREKAAIEGGATPTSEPDLNEALDVRAALDSLDARDRMVLMLRGSGFSYAEIAEVVGLAPSSIGTTLVRAQRRFREVYEGAPTGAEKKE